MCVIPVYNEAERLSDFLRDLPAGVRYCFVDDGSTDASPSLLDAYCDGHSQAQVVHLDFNQGKSRALLQALQEVARACPPASAAPEDALVFIDSDGQHDPGQIVPMVECWRQRKLDMLVAARDLLSYRLDKVLGNVFLTLWTSLLTGRWWSDTQCGFRVMPLRELELVREVISGQGYCCEQEMCVALALCGWKIDNSFAIRVHHARSHSTWKDAWAITLAGWRTWKRWRHYGARSPKGL